MLKIISEESSVLDKEFVDTLHNVFKDNGNRHETVVEVGRDIRLGEILNNYFKEDK